MDLNELYDIDLNEFNEEYVENEEKEFRIDSPELANWAIKKVKEEQDRLKDYEVAIQSEIDRLKGKLEYEKTKSNNSTSWLRHKLNEYLDLDTVKPKKTKTKMSIELPYGKIVRQLPKLVMVSTYGEKTLRKDKKLLEWVKSNESTSNKYLITETTELVNWSELKKSLTIKDGMIVTDDGEIVECLNIIEEPMKVEVE